MSRVDGPESIGEPWHSAPKIMASSYDSSLDPFSIGSTVGGRYRIESLLGRGGMGAVYRVTDERVGEEVALKALGHSSNIPDHRRDRFVREVRLSRRISHPNVVRIHDLEVVEGWYFLTMELVEGEDLGALLSRSRALSPGRTAAIAREIATGLEAIHATGVVHRDLKPANVLLERGGRVVLTDFGIARIVGEAYRPASGMLGTPAYMAPEQVLGRPVDSRADIYALGILLFEMLTGEPPFIADNAIATAMRRLREPVPDPRTKVATPDSLADVILRCLEQRPVARFESARRVTEALAPIAESGASHSDTTAHLPPDAVWDGGRRRTTRSERRLAVLPMQYRGETGQSFLAEVLTDELTDLLCRTQGLRVLASGATARFAKDRDPREIGDALDVDAVVDGAIQASKDRVRVSVRLADAGSRAVMWSDRFEASIGDVFELQDSVARRVAESLRIGIDAIPDAIEASGEAVELYLRARSQLGDIGFRGASDALDLLERALAIDPGFGPAISAHALCCMRAWFIPGLEPGRCWDRETRTSVARALERAPDLAETHLVAGMLGAQDGRFRDAALALSRALEIAPTCAEAHEYLGRLLCEADRGEKGLQHLRLSLELDPRLSRCLTDIAREHSLGSRLDAFDATLRELTAAKGADGIVTLQTRLRHAAWYRDRETIEDVLARLGAADLPDRGMMDRYGRGMLSEIRPSTAADALMEVEGDGPASARFRTFVRQLGCELLMVAEQREAAGRLLVEAAEDALVDLAWLGRCPLLEPLRGEATYRRAEAAVRTRVSSIWLT